MVESMARDRIERLVPVFDFVPSVPFNTRLLIPRVKCFYSGIVERKKSKLELCPLSQGQEKNFSLSMDSNVHCLEFIFCEKIRSKNNGSFIRQFFLQVSYKVRQLLPIFYTKFLPLYQTVSEKRFSSIWMKKSFMILHIDPNWLSSIPFNPFMERKKLEVSLILCLLSSTQF